MTFLSGVFPLGERSGVNLQGEYGPTWEGVSLGEKTKADEKDAEMEVAKSLEEPEAKEGEAQGDNMQIDSKEVKKSVPAEGLAEKKEGESLEFRLSYVTV
jgi:THO complex subunit 1